MASTRKTRLVRQAPLAERLKAYLNPFDFLLWVSEELNGGEWEDIVERWSLTWGIGFNLVFVVARGSSGARSRSGMDDVFGDGGGWSSGWGLWIASAIAHTLAMLSILNAAYTFNRKRRYRLFESSLTKRPTTSHSLHRVRVDSSPAASSPLKFLTEMLPTASSLASNDTEPPEPNSTQDEVWELAVWDPTKVSLRLFTLFSPGHVLVYWLYLPLAPLDAQPSVTVATALLLAALMSIQLTLLTANFTQQSKDSTLIHKEVQHEYDAKFVHPSLYKPVRDVGTQCTASLPRGTPSSVKEVLTYTPTTYVNRGFKVQPSPHYAAHLPQDTADINMSNTERAALVRSTSTPLSSTNIFSPSSQSTVYSSPLKPPTPATLLNRQLQQQNRLSNTSGVNMNRTSRPSTAVSSTGDGGSFGIYSHAYSPLKRSSFMPQQQQQQQQMGSSPFKGSSPLKDPRRGVSPSKAEESPVIRRRQR